jgi:hypothetical protein
MEERRTKLIYAFTLAALVLAAAAAPSMAAGPAPGACPPGAPECPEAAAVNGGASHSPGRVYGTPIQTPILHRRSRHKTPAAKAPTP